LKGTDVKITTSRMDGVKPNTFKLGGLPEIQTFVFRTTSAALSAAASSETYNL